MLLPKPLENVAESTVPVSFAKRMLSGAHTMLSAPAIDELAWACGISPPVLCHLPLHALLESPSG